MNSLARVMIALVAALLTAVPCHAQSVRGKVIDTESGLPVAGVAIRLLDAAGARVAEMVSDANGAFRLNPRGPGDFILHASHIAYREVRAPVVVRPQEQVEINVSISQRAIAIEPITVVARRTDPRYDATEEGFYARRLTTPTMGPARVFLPHDAEMVNAIDARDVLQWVSRIRGCTVVYWNGRLVTDSTTASLHLQTSVSQLEGVEFYRSPLDAPPTFREMPIYLLATETVNCSVVALWPRTGRYLAEFPTPVLPPLGWDGGLSVPIYIVTGDDTPGPGFGIDATVFRNVRFHLDLGLFARMTSHSLDAETADDITANLNVFGSPFTGESRNLKIVMVGIEPRWILRERPSSRWSLSARVQGGQRRIAQPVRGTGNPTLNITSTGYGAGASAALDKQLTGRIAATAAIGADWMTFGDYKQINDRSRPTAATWIGSSFRIGFTYRP
jgi:hypothetical protein